MADIGRPKRILDVPERHSVPDAWPTLEPVPERGPAEPARPSEPAPAR